MRCLTLLWRFCARYSKKSDNEVEFAGERWRLQGIYWGRYLVDDFPFGAIERDSLGEVANAILTEAELTYLKNFSKDASLPHEYQQLVRYL